MPHTDPQYQLVLSRLTALENHANDMAVALDKLVTLSQVNQLLTLLQTQVDDLNLQVQALEERVTAIEEEPIT